MPSSFAADRQLHLVVPGLFGPQQTDRWNKSVNRTSIEELEHLLSRAQPQGGLSTGLERTLFELAGVSVDPSRDLPLGAVTRLADGGKQDDGWWMRADPVHLRADRSQLILFPGAHIDIKLDEALALAEEFNRFFAVDGWYLDALRPTRWYLRLPHDPRIRTYDLAEVVGHNILDFLPTGERGRNWHPLLNEIQMLFHSSQVNKLREQRGALTINSVWFWGGGSCPGVDAHWERVYCDEPVGRGLAMLAGTPVDNVPKTADQWLAQGKKRGKTLVVLPSLQEAIQNGDYGAWCHSLEAMNRDWFASLPALLKQGHVAELKLYGANGVAYRVDSSTLRQFWRRRRRFGSF